MPAGTSERGISAVDLHDRSNHRDVRGLSPAGLAGWLLRENLALEQDGRLFPTARCVELGAGIA